ncbi:MAG: D-alanyl-D-alanine carboxypeptidase family protein [Alphaproteobacteria bacterium]|nr:D-alanyl-D-alanine carboxypeptidase family protein [Alphaproteobacteria bacterium]
MFSDALLPEPKFICEIEDLPVMVEISQADNISFNNRYTSVKTIRKYIYEMLLKAKLNLPEGYNFVIYEAYRPLSSQIALWNEVVAKEKNNHPEKDINSEDFIALCNKFVANPYRQGSGHQSGAAIDVSLVDDKGKEHDMGGTVRGFDNTAEFDCPNISKEARNNREILKKALEEVGFVNYPSEWWHYSFGDRLWAKLTGSKIAIFGKLDL